MSANYKVNIELDTTKLDTQLKDLGVKVDAVGKKRTGTAKEVQSAEEKAAAAANKELRLQNSIEASRARQIQLSKKGVATVGGLVNLSKQVNADNLQQIKQVQLQTDLQIKQAKNDIAQADKKLVTEEKVAKVVKSTGRAKAGYNTEEERYQMALQNMAARTVKSRRASRMERRRSLSLGKDIVRNTTKEVALNQKNAEALAKSKQIKADQIKAGPFRIGGDYSDIATRRTYTRSGQETNYINFGGNRTVKFNRQGALSSAAISGAFPLLFGQNPLVAAAGAVGGGLGGGFGGQMGGFAGGLVATAAVSSILSAVDGIKQLGQAMGPLEKNIAAMSAAAGTAGTLRGKELQLMEQVSGKQVAYTAALKDMSDVIGDEGVQNLQQFGSDVQRLGTKFAEFILKVQAGFADLFGSLIQESATDRAIRIEKAIKEGAPVRTEGYLPEHTKELERLFELRDKLRAEGADKPDISTLDATTLSIAGIDTEILRLEEIGKQYEKTLRAISEEMERIDSMDIYSEAGRAKAQEEYWKNLQRINKVYADIGRTIRNGMVDAIEGAIEGTKTLGEVASSVFRSIAKMLIQYGVTTGLKGTNWKIFEGLHEGGTAKRGNPYIVGERGPELFVPNKTGTVVPNDELGGNSTSVVVNVDASGTEVQGDEPSAATLGRLIGAAVQSEIIKQQRSGGLLSR